MSLASHNALIQNSIQEKLKCIQEGLKCHELYELKSHLEYLIKSLKEAQVDLLNISKQINQLEEVMNACK